MVRKIMVLLPATFLCFGMISCNLLINPTPDMIVLDNSMNEIQNATGNVNFGEVLLQNPESLTFTIKSVGNAKLYLTGQPLVHIQGTAGASCFTVTAYPKSPVSVNKQSNFTIEFLPTEAGSFSATVTILNNDEQRSIFQFAVKGKGIEPEIFVHDSSNNQIINNVGVFDFAVNRLNIERSENFTIKNLGSSTLELTGDPKVEISGTSSDQFSVVSQPSESIVPGASSTFKIEFRTNSIGDFSAMVSIANSDFNENPYTFTITGIVAEPEIRITDSSDIEIPSLNGEFTFPNTNLNSTASETFNIYNDGTYKLMLGSSPIVEISGTNANNFTVVSMPVSEIAPGYKSQFTIEFTPNQAIALEAIVSIMNNDINENPYTYKIKGVGLSPEIKIVDSSANELQSGSSTFHYGSIVLTSSVPETFTIYNIGNEDLVLSGSPAISITGAQASFFTVVTPPATTTIAPGSSTTFVIEFSPTNLGLCDATVSIENNDIDENPFIFYVKGWGVTPEIEVWHETDNLVSGSAEVDFGVEFTGSATAAHTFTIKNVGSADLNLTGSVNLIEISGPSQTMFKINQSSTTTPVGHPGSTTFTVTFEPTSHGSKEATITIPNDDLDEDPFIIKLVGTALTPGPSMLVKVSSSLIENSSGVYSFNYRNLGIKGRKTIFRIENIGTSSLQLTGPGIVNVSGANASEFNLDVNSTSNVVTVSSSTTFSITFSPTSRGIKTASVSIPNNDPYNNPYTFTLYGINTFGGDFNGDGIEDIVIGAEASNAAYVFYGTSSPQSVINVANADLKLTGHGRFGYSVANAGDFNRDGIDDIIVGAVDDDDGGTGSGCAFMFFGRRNFGSTIDSSNASVKFVGENVNDGLGFSVSYAGDFNRDGFYDIVIGAAYADRQTGAAFMFFGRANPGSVINASTADMKIVGEQDYENFGYSVAGVGDYNCDGFDDVIVGAPNTWDGMSQNRGIAYVIYGCKSPATPINASSADIIMKSMSGGHYLGKSVSYGGDFNNDGYDDLCVSCIGAQFNTGVIYIGFGAPNHNSLINEDLIGFKIYGENGNDGLGSSIAMARDINSDGISDIIIGATGNDDGGSNAGAVYVIYGHRNIVGPYPVRYAEIKFIGADSEDKFGSSVFSAGDFNGDGRTDILIGAPYDDDGGNESGCAFLFFSTANPSSPIDAANATVKFVGENSSHRLGCSLGGGY